MTTLIIARHGNTFGPEYTPTRVGARTDLPLVDSGQEQARAIGRYLRDNRLIPDVVYASALQRAQDTAKIAIKESGVTNPIFTLDIFNEIDYGPDENKTEDEVIARIGKDEIAAWDENGTPPDGWIVDPDQIIQNWIDFAGQITKHCHPEQREGSDAPIMQDELDPSLDLVQDDEVHMVVTSNGIARFAPHITGDFDGFRAQNNIKLSTGALAILKYSPVGWTVQDWNIKP